MIKLASEWRADFSSRLNCQSHYKIQKVQVCIWFIAISVCLVYFQARWICISLVDFLLLKQSKWGDKADGTGNGVPRDELRASLRFPDWRHLASAGTRFIWTGDGIKGILSWCCRNTQISSNNVSEGIMKDAQLHREFDLFPPTPRRDTETLTAN